MLKNFSVLVSKTRVLPFVTDERLIEEDKAPSGGELKKVTSPPNQKCELLQYLLNIKV
jgi:hypothetical protein